MVDLEVGPHMQKRWMPILPIPHHPRINTTEAKSAWPCGRLASTRRRWPVRQGLEEDDDDGDLVSSTYTLIYNPRSHTDSQRVLRPLPRLCLAAVGMDGQVRRPPHLPLHGPPSSRRPRGVLARVRGSPVSPFISAENDTFTSCWSTSDHPHPTFRTALPASPLRRRPPPSPSSSRAWTVPAPSASGS